MVIKLERNQEKPHCTIILLAGGSGKRMGTDKPKQFLEIAGKPLIWHSLNALERSAVVDDCILVAAAGDISYMKQNILEPGGFSKVKAVAEGGRERFESVWKGLEKLSQLKEKASLDVIMIHDGARPFLTEDILQRCFQGALQYRACVAAVPSKDTVTVADEEGFEAQTPDRRLVWNVQTPQAFTADVLYDAFSQMARDLDKPDGLDKLSWITDDASVAAYYSHTRIRLVQGDYRNIKVTTREDLQIMEGFLI
ncbi:MAG: 2-C-methyl-D-erythritol 4-phosphate cytidylyltransferase [Bacteroidales bacterium]|nr:2-C-methyl-D-erythritol 4-phosphate cytidylyltransferase [Lachnoclostridium sp.]MCM1383800.1 2-C-methyl-D-erythritol 4-phosphate cytidylyltransferase [Lachnoclostridium sp.]MCM1464428.1 2-C-methyl-D-erythritol 4-phosphate cytidylyltransferase [Bacteroidales bacterium]